MPKRDQPPEEEWEASHHQVREAIDQGKPEPIGWYLREVAETLARIAALFDPPSKEGFRVKLVRGQRGKPKDGWKEMLADDRLGWEVKRRGQYTKIDSAIEEVSKKTGKSKATIYRAISKGKKRR
jgi:hypothetical protein